MREQVFLGYQPIADLSGSSLAILCYLYSHPDRSCNKEELYYRVLRGLDHEPRVPDDPDWEVPKNIQGAMDTALWRLRQSLEPNPSEPIYIVSSRGKGIIRLENTW
jgi:DNA-binding response OmpR family regulator